MRNRLVYAVSLMWAALLLGGAFRPSVAPPGAGGIQPQPRSGYPAPSIALADLDGKPVRLSDLQGKAVFLNFWASWCGPCRLEMPEVERLSRALPTGTAILTVNMTAQEQSEDTVRAFLAAQGYDFPVALDRQGTVGEAYQVLSLPTSLFISPAGVVTARVNGPLSHAAMLDYLKAAGR